MSLRYRKIHLRMWGDQKFLRLSPLKPSGQALWIYLLTGPHQNQIPGLFRAGPASLAEALGWPLEAFREAFREVFAEGLIEADEKTFLIWIPNALKYNSPVSPNVVRSWRNSWNDIPECELKEKAATFFEEFLKSLGCSYLDAFNGIRKPIGKPSGKALRKASPKASRKASPNKEKEKELRERDISTPPVPPRESGGVPVPETTPNEQEKHFSTEWIKSLWNETITARGIPRIEKWTHKRHLAALRVLKDHPDRQDWRRAFEAINRSEFCRGGNDRAWVATIDWILERKGKDVLQALIEGAYQSKPAIRKPATTWLDPETEYTPRKDWPE